MKQRYQLKTITPVHIGSGQMLNHLDGYYANGRWHQIDLDRVLKHPATDVNRLTSSMAQHHFRWEHHLPQDGTNPADFAAYSLPCSQNPNTVEIRAAIKNFDNCPFIPGSTLKGAIRTMLLAELINIDDTLYQDSREHLERLTKRKGGNPWKETPALRIEQDAFGRDANHDVLRTLHISDTTPIETNSLAIGMAWTVTLDPNDQLVQKVDRGREYKNFVQQIQAGQRLTFTLKIDELLFREREKAQLRFTDSQMKALQDVAEICSLVTEEFIQSEHDFFQYYHFPEMVNFYERLFHKNVNLPEGAFLLQLGWGTGYRANTVTSLFTSDEEAPIDLLELQKRFRLGESRSRRGQYDNREFPKTRRILYRGENPICPLGWVEISPLGA